MSIDRLAFLEGTWRGEGHGSYPTIDEFEYVEEVMFSSVPDKPFLVYRQSTTVGGTPSHTEAGYLRSPSKGVAEWVIAMPTGITEVLAGPLTDDSLDLRATNVGRTPTAKDVRSVARRLVVEGDTLKYELHLAAVGQSEQIHLRAALARVD